jgi:hypothetical protein
MKQAPPTTATPPTTTPPPSPLITPPPSYFPQTGPSGATSGNTQFASSVFGMGGGINQFVGGASGGGSNLIQTANATTRGGMFVGGGVGGVNNNISSWSQAAQNRIPGPGERSTWAGLAFGPGGGGAGGGMGPLSSDNWQMSRTASVTIRNVPGANIYATGAGMG